LLLLGGARAALADRPAALVSESAVPPAQRARLLEAAHDPTLAPWQRDMMQQLGAGGPAASTTPPALMPATAPPLRPSSAEDGVWAPVVPLMIPGTRYAHTAVYDPVRDRMLVFGGIACPTLLHDVWELTLTGNPTWNPIYPEGTAPAAGAAVSMVYDLLRDRVILFGGSMGGVRYNETWALTLGDAPTWTQLTPTGTPPLPRDYHTAIYDPVRDRMVVFGGTNPPAYFSDVWALTFGDSLTWTPLQPGGEATEPRAFHSAIYDPIGDRMVVFGGNTSYGAVLTNDLWLLRLAEPVRWRQITPQGTPPQGRGGHTAIFDPTVNQMVLFGGYATGGTYLNDTWTLSLAMPSTWTMLSPTGPPPSPRDYHTAIYDPVRQQMVVFAGIAGGYLCPQQDTWGLALTGPPAWSTLVPPISYPPSPRRDAAGIYDPVRQRFVLFGGSPCNGGCYASDVWTLTLTDRPIWYPLFPAGGVPAPRWGASAIYDPVRDQMVMFGGGSGYLCEPMYYCPYDNNDVWALSLGATPTWTQLLPSGPLPGPRHWHSAIYDPVRDQMMIFGGQGQGSTNDVWALSLGDAPAWTQLQPTGPVPLPRLGQVALYDPVRDRLVVFGGAESLRDPPYYQHGNDTWALSLRGTPAWTELMPSGALPPGRRLATGIYDPLQDRLVIFGGQTDDVLFNDTWALSFSGSAAWAALQPQGPVPAARSSVTGIYDAAQAQMVIFGGVTRVTVLNDTWTLQWDQATAVTVGPAEVTVTAGEVRLVWRVPGAAGEPGTVYRRTATGAWEPQAAPLAEAGDRVVYEDRTVQPGGHYSYALVVGRGGQAVWSAVTEVEVPRAALLLDPLHPNPMRSPVALVLHPLSDAPLEVGLFDIAGRPVVAQRVSPAGRATVRVPLEAARSLAPGVYLVQVRQGVATARIRLCVVR
jgi:hypothetical protein